MAQQKNILVNGVLTPVWQTDATAQEIDDAVAAAAGAVRYDAAQSLTVAQQTTARDNIGAADKETQDKVQAIYAPSSTVTVAAAELQDYIDALPRMLTERLTISVSSGTLSEALIISSFYGSGFLALTANGSVTLAGGVVVQNCRMRVSIEGMQISGGAQGSNSKRKGTVFLYEARMAFLANCTLTPAETAEYGIDATVGSKAYVYSGSISGYTTATIVSSGSEVVLSSVAASDNTSGAEVYNGGIVLLCGSTPDTVGGSTNAKGGGIIAKADGTLL